MKITKNFIESTFIVTLVSIFAAIGGIFFSLPFWGTFLFALVLQFIAFYSLGKITSNYILAKTKEKELEKLENLSTILNCAYCQKPNLMIFDPNNMERVEFQCDHCKNQNLVSMQFVVAQISKPLDIPKVVGIPSESVE